MSDARRTNYGNIHHKLEDIFIIGLCTIICGGEDYADTETCGTEREAFRRKFLELPNGIPDSDTFRRLFETLDPIALSECLVNWLDAELPKRCVIAADRKTIRGSENKKHNAYHIVSAFVAESQITLGEITVDEKSNEIAAVLDLLDLLYIDDAVVITDSMICQKKIVEKIANGGADYYCIALKGIQPTLHRDVEDYFHEYVKETLTYRTAEKDMEGLKCGIIICLVTSAGWKRGASEKGMFCFLFC